MGEHGVNSWVSPVTLKAPSGRRGGLQGPAGESPASDDWLREPIMWIPLVLGIGGAPCSVVSGLCGTWKPRWSPPVVVVGIVVRRADVASGNRMLKKRMPVTET